MTKLTEQVSDTKPMLSERMWNDTVPSGGVFVWESVDDAIRAVRAYTDDVEALEQSLAQRTEALRLIASGRCADPADVAKGVLAAAAALEGVK